MNTSYLQSQEIYWKLLKQTPRQIGSCDVIDTGIGSPWMNGVLPKELLESEVDESVEKVAGYFEKRELPFGWWSEVSSEPKNLKESLAKKGLAYCEKLPGLILNLDEMKEIPKPQDLQIQVVSNRESLRFFVDVLIRAYEGPPEEALLVEEFFMKAGLKHPILHFLGKENQTSVSVGSLFIHEGEALIFHVATLPEKRKRGIGSFLMFSMLKYAQYHECKSSFLTATPMALNMYLKMGYKQVIDFHFYV